MNKKEITGKIIITTGMVLAALICIIMAGSVSYAENAKDHLVVGVPVDRCPMFYVDSSSGQVTGIGADLLSVAADEAGYDVTFKALKEENLKDALDDPEYDVIMPFGSAITSSSGRQSVVSDNLMQIPFVLVTADNGSLKAIDDLHIGMLSSLRGLAETVSQIYPEIDIIFFETMDESVRALRGGKVDALLHNSYVWSYELQKPSYSDLSIQPQAMLSLDFRVGTLDSESGRIIIERLNSGIAAI